MNNNYKKIASALMLSTVLLASSGCKKTFPPLPEESPINLIDNSGCNDIDSPFSILNSNGNDDCQYVYATSYEITYFPEDDPSGGYWDNVPFNTEPDLYLNVGPLGADLMIFQSTERGNQDYNTPSIWEDDRLIKLENKVYKWHLLDNDAASVEDMAEGTFNPIEYIKTNGSSGSIISTSQGTQFVLHYIIK